MLTAPLTGLSPSETLKISVTAQHTNRSLPSLLHKHVFVLTAPLSGLSPSETLKISVTAQHTDRSLGPDVSSV
ncbi:hypothetical protein [Paenibacillus sp. N3.4]|uniref:hypothetical protein n=1 Tax=Paenibacillus sp. N3.4 TaxID=2603222 RepID=UPI00164FE912|nr:hypothetical protein [Paenibacillus sp. N3.4]